MPEGLGRPAANGYTHISLVMWKSPVIPKAYCHQPATNYLTDSAVAS